MVLRPCRSACIVRDSECRVGESAVLSVRLHEFYERACTGVSSMSFLVEALSLLLED
jgi:hypothetical protein